MVRHKKQKQFQVNYCPWIKTDICGKHCCFHGSTADDTLNFDPIPLPVL